MKIINGLRRFLRSRRGSAMLIVMVFILISMTIVALFERQTRSLFAVKATEYQAEKLWYDDTNRVIMARGLRLLQTAAPSLPPDNYACRVVFAPPEPTDISGELVFTSSDTYRIVDARALTEADVPVSSCTCPSDFSKMENLWASCSN